jgi:hypothetical protein
MPSRLGPIKALSYSIWISLSIPGSSKRWAQFCQDLLTDFYCYPEVRAMAFLSHNQVCGLNPKMNANHSWQV